MMTEEEAQQKCKALCDQLLDMAAEMNANRFRTTLFSALLGAITALPDDYADAMLAPATNKKGKDMENAANEFMAAIKKCRAIQIRSLEGRQWN